MTPQAHRFLELWNALPELATQLDDDELITYEDQLMHLRTELSPADRSTLPKLLSSKAVRRELVRFLTIEP